MRQRVLISGPVNERKNDVRIAGIDALTAWLRPSRSG
jgi:hypothetical protein